MQTPDRNIPDNVVILEHSYDDVHTAFSRPTMTEEGIRDITLPSFEISLPAEQATYAKATLSNIKRHACQH